MSLGARVGISLSVGSGDLSSTELFLELQLFFLFLLGILTVRLFGIVNLYNSNYYLGTW